MNERTRPERLDRPWIPRDGFLIDADGGAEPLDVLNLGLVQLADVLTGVRREALEEASLSFLVDNVVRERRLARPREARHHRESIARNLDVDVLQIVLGGTSDDDSTGHDLGSWFSVYPSVNQVSQAAFARSSFFSSGVLGTSLQCFKKLAVYRRSPGGEE